MKKMEPVEKVLKENEKKNNIKKILLAALCAVLLLGAGFWFGHSGLDLVTNSQSTIDSNKLKAISQILESSWYYANQVENLDESLLALGVGGTAGQVEDYFTSYLTNEGASAFEGKLLASDKGIGLGYGQREDGYYIESIYLDSPAEKAGLLKGDKLISINNEEVNEELIEKLPDLIQSSDQLSIMIERDGKPMTVEIKPETYDSSVALDIQKEQDYALIDLNSFSKNTATELKKALERIQKAGVNNLIIDVRNNTGGYLTTAMAVLNLFLKDDLVLFYDSYADGKEEEYRSGQGNTPFEFENIYILQNEESASASEMFIAAMQYYLPETVTTIGSTTYGKGSVQDRYTFEDGSALKYTRSLWLTPAKISINNEGIAPEVEITTPLENITLYNGVEEVSVETNSPNTKGVLRLLDYLGYHPGDTEGEFTQQAQAALSQFQADQGLEVTGTGNEETLSALVAAASDRASLVEPDLALEKAVSMIVSNQANETGSQNLDESQGILEEAMFEDVQE